VGHVLWVEETRNAYNILVGKPEERSPLARPVHRLGRIELTEIGWESVDWIHLAQDRDQ